MDKKLTGIEKLEDRIVLATITSAADGAWSANSSWVGGSIPTGDDDVVIEHSILLDTDAIADDVTVNGQLEWSTDTDVHFQVETLVIGPSGSYVQGTETAPVTANHLMTIRDTGPIDIVADPTVVSRGFRSMGSVRIHGEAKSAFELTWVAPHMGCTVLSFEDISQSNWQVGDTLIVPGTVRPVDSTTNMFETVHDEDEIVTITAINGNDVTMSSGLLYDHVPPRPGLDIPIANISRNIEITSENTTDFDRMGHIMMASGDVDARYFSLDGVGRNDRSQVVTDPDGQGNGTENSRGRYAWHHHLNGYDTHSQVVGAVAMNNPGWGFVNHGSSVTFQDNITYNIKGAGFVAESGNEVGSFESNLAIRSRGKFFYEAGPSNRFDQPGNSGGLGSAGHGFWIQSPIVEVVGNFATGHKADAYFLHTGGIIDPATGEKVTIPLDQIPAHLLDELPPAVGTKYWNDDYTAVVPGKVPYYRVEDNVAFGTGTALSMRWHRTDAADPVLDGSHGDVIEGLTGWGIEFFGIGIGYTGGVLWHKTTLLGDIDDPISLSSRELAQPGIYDHDGLGKGFIANINSNNQFFDKVDIRGFTVGIQAMRKADTVIDDAWLQNISNIRIITAQANQVEGQRTVRVSGVTLLDLSDEALAGRTAYDVDLVKRIDRALVGVSNNIDLEMQSMLTPDTITLNGKRLYFHDQAADAIPFPEVGSPSFMYDHPVYGDYIGLTQQQLFDQHGVAFGGFIAPESAVESVFDDINGLVDYNWD